MRVEDARSLWDGSSVPDDSGFIHTDIRGSVIAKTAIDGPASINREAAYDAWGGPVDVSSLQKPRHQFVDFEPDAAAGYYYMGARVYDPTLRRWLSPDPLMAALPEVDSDRGSQLNLYAYTSNNPTTSTDRSGRCLQCTGVDSMAQYLAGGDDAVIKHIQNTQRLYLPIGRKMQSAAVSVFAAIYVGTVTFWFGLSEAGGPEVDWGKEVTNYAIAAAFMAAGKALFGLAGEVSSEGDGWGGRSSWGTRYVSRLLSRLTYLRLL